MTLHNRMKQAKNLIRNGVKKDDNPLVAEYYARIAEAKNIAEAKRNVEKEKKKGAK